MSARKRRIRKEGKAVEQWFVDFRFKHADGTAERFRIDSPVNTRRGAEQYEREVRQQLQDGKYRSEQEAPKDEVPTLEQFQDEFLIDSKNNNKPSTLNTKRYMLRLHLVPFFGPMRLDKIGTQEIERYKALKLEEGQDPRSINNHLIALRKLLNLAVDYKKLTHVPRFKAMKFGEQDFEFLDFAEADRFLAAAPLEWKPMLMLALRTGLRRGELLALKWEDIDLKAGRLIVKRTLWEKEEGTPKSGKRREIPLSTQTLAMLKAHRDLNTYVFSDGAGKRLTPTGIQNVVPAVCRKAGLPKKLSWHDLRHTFASHLVMKGRSLVEVQQLLGHSTIVMTMRYAHLSPDVKRAAVEVLDAPVGKVGQWVGND
jgi:integrase